MVEEQTRRVEDAMTKIVTDIDKNYLRKIQGAMHRCAAQCCENSLDSMESVHRCIENCSVSLNDAQQFVQSELSSVQNRLQRCVLECNDEIKDKMGSYPSDSEVKKYNLEFEKCAIRCVDKNVELLPAMLQRMKEVLNRKYHTSLHANNQTV